jgi:hypothetical protein
VDIITAIKSKKVGWEERVARMGAVRNVRKALVEKPRGKTPLERHTNERIIY